jgi:hypothetical protein
MIDSRPNIEPFDWSDADIATLPQGAPIKGFETVDEIEIFSRILGAQMLSLLNTGSTEQTSEFISSPNHWASRHRGKQGASVSQRFYKGVQEPLGDHIVFDETVAVCNRIRRPEGDNHFYGRPKEQLGKPWVRDIHIVTATRLADIETNETKSYAGLSITMALWRKHGQASVQRTFLPGVRIAMLARDLYPNTTDFS